ncbi:MAG: HslU--HslV peptidase ATPase subunit, partial [Thermus sp.]
ATLLRVSPFEVASGRLDGAFVEVQVEEEAQVPFMGVLGGEQFSGMAEMLKGLLPKRPVRKRMTVREAREVLRN